MDWGSGGFQIAQSARGLLPALGVSQILLPPGRPLVGQEMSSVRGDAGPRGPLGTLGTRLSDHKEPSFFSPPRPCTITALSF